MAIWQRERQEMADREVNNLKNRTGDAVSHLPRKGARQEGKKSNEWDHSSNISIRTQPDEQTDTSTKYRHTPCN